MEAQVEKNVKKKTNKQTIKQRKKRKKLICAELNHWKIEELEKILEKKESNMNYRLSQNGWDTLGYPCPLDVGGQDLVTEPR